jgi:hypothetical protein
MKIKKTQKIKISEKDIQKSVIDYLNILENQGKIYFIRTNSFAGYIKRRNGTYGWIQNNKSGCPDIIVCGHSGKFIGLEIKVFSGKQSDYQKLAEADIRKAGGEYYIVRSVEDVKMIIPCTKKVKEKESIYI